MPTKPDECTSSPSNRRSTLFQCGFEVTPRGMLQMTEEQLADRHERWHSDPPKPYWVEDGVVMSSDGEKTWVWEENSQRWDEVEAE